MQETHTSTKRNWAAKLLAIAVVASMVGSTIVLFAPEASARTGTGSFGYIYKDHLESDGPSYSWEELIGASGTTKLIGYTTDAAQGPFNLPFTFKFYDQEFTTWSNGGDNGYITFASAVNYQWTPSPLPAGALGNGEKIFFSLENIF